MNDLLIDALRRSPRRWLVTGAAGFIGSNLVETLLSLDQEVRGLDNFATGHARNLEDIRASVTEAQWARFTFLEGDIQVPSTCAQACKGMEVVLHQAALGSVPRSIKDPIASHQNNVDGFLNILQAARLAGVGRMVYASSSSVYGDSPVLPKCETHVGAPLSPYALTKSINEQYADVFARTYGFKAIGLRYFNVFGKRQDPDGPYAAVIPRWIDRLLRGEVCDIHGDGETSRDFCHVVNAVQANLLAGTAPEAALGTVYNVSVGGRTTLKELHEMMCGELDAALPGRSFPSPRFLPFRDGDIRHSQASIQRIQEVLGYQPTHDVLRGIRETVAWYLAASGARV